MARSVLTYLCNSMKIAGVKINLSDALYVKSAEFWLQLGQPSQALLELRRLSQRGRPHPWASKVFVSALHRLAS